MRRNRDSMWLTRWPHMQLGLCLLSLCLLAGAKEEKSVMNIVGLIPVSAVPLDQSSPSSSGSRDGDPLIPSVHL